MINVVDYLNENGFTVYAVSGTDREMVREMILQKGLNISENHVIGMDCMYGVAGKESQDLLDYQLGTDDKIVRTDKLLIKNVKMNKVQQIVQEIGKQPVLAFGNSSGDISMLTYVTTSNAHKSAAFMLVADDSERDFSNTSKATDNAQK